MHYLNQAKKILSESKLASHERYRKIVALGGAITSASILNESGESEPGQPTPVKPTPKEESLQILISSMSFFHRIGLPPRYWQETCETDLKALGKFIDSELVSYQDAEKLTEFVEAHRVHKAQFAKIAATGDFTADQIASWNGSGT